MDFSSTEMCEITEKEIIAMTKIAKVRNACKFE
jgi:hypothetical protein